MSCKQCGDVLPPRPPGKKGAPPKFCSAQCRTAHYNSPREVQKRQAYAARYNRSALYGLSDSVSLELRDRPCDICGADRVAEQQHHIDHCHETNAVRGVLCLNCNTALGKFQDSPELLTRAAHYLTRGADYRAVDREA